MSFGVGVRNAIAIGLGGIVSLFSGTFDRDLTVSNLETESGANLVQEDGSYILLE
jgi:hypothetical protein